MDLSNIPRDLNTKDLESDAQGNSMCWFVYGEWQDSVMLGLLKQDWLTT